ncbi:MAG: TetR/AcrR family transcriptional regulator [Bdellovibrionota bacterium]
MTRPAEKTRKELEGERTRQKIIEAAVKLFAEKGYRATSVATIAKACGISTATVFWHFQTKERLLQGIFSDMISEVQKNMGEKRTGKAPGEEVVAVLAEDEFDYFTEHADHMRMLLGLILEAESEGGNISQLLRGLIRSYVDLLAAQLRKTHPALQAAESKERAGAFVATLAGIVVLRVADASIVDAAPMVRLVRKLLLDSPPLGS